MTVAINLNDLIDLANQSRDVFDQVALLFGDALMDAPLVEIAPSRDEYGIVPTWNDDLRTLCAAAVLAVKGNIRAYIQRGRKRWEVVPREVLRGAKIEDLEKLLAGT
jgi:hypothetical protein